MKIGVFDSGLGGLYTMRSIVRVLPEYDYVYLGDTKRLPYGNRSRAVVREFLGEGVDFLYKKGCRLIIVACNTASADAIGDIAKSLPHTHPGLKIYGMIIPTVEEAKDMKRVGIIATNGTIQSGAYDRELAKQNRKTKLIPLATPLLVPLIENGGDKWIYPVLKEYLEFFKNKNIEGLILGCTHYPIVERDIKKILGKKIKILAQTEIVPKKIKAYLKTDSALASKLSKNHKKEFYVTDTTERFTKLARKWFGKNINLQKVSMEKQNKPR